MYAIVEDCETTRALLVTVIRGITSKDVIDFGSAESFIRELKIREHKLHAIFLDINLPGVNGIDLIKSIHKLDAYAETPIVICSANNNRETIMAALRGGAVNFVVKPFTREQIKTVILALPSEDEVKAEVVDVPVKKEVEAGDDVDILNEATEKMIDN